MKHGKDFNGEYERGKASWEERGYLQDKGKASFIVLSRKLILMKI
jgi:hypothetical protein